MRVRALAIAAGCALAAGGCGGAGGHASSASSGGSGATTARADRILAAAEAALDRVHSLHLQATATVAGHTVSESVDIVLPGRTLEVARVGAGTSEVLTIGRAIYLHGNRAYYSSIGATGATLTKLSGRWLTATASEAPGIGGLFALSNPATLGRCLIGQHRGTLSLGGEGTAGGRRATVLIDAGDRPGSAPERIYIAATGPSLPLRVTSTGPSRAGGASTAACGTAALPGGSPVVASSDELIGDYNAPIRITAPAGAVSIASLTTPTHATSGIAAAPVRTARTKLGTVGYRTVGSGAPLVLITGYSGTMESWDPRFVNALAQRHRVVIFDNAGIGATQALPSPLTIDAMADQTAALIETLGLGRPDVLGWSMGGMIAQALAIRHPTSVRRLVLAATFAGTGKVARPSQAAIDALTGGNEQATLADLFPADQSAAAQAFLTATGGYPSSASAPAALVKAQAQAVTDWWNGADAAGRKTATISVPTLVADGTVDRIDPVSNSRTLAALIPGARLTLYPDAGHAFLFQDETSFVALIESFLG